MGVFGYDVFGWTNQLYRADEENNEKEGPVEGPTFKSLLEDPDVVAEDLGGGGRWSDGGKTLSLRDDEHLFIVFRPGWEVHVKTHDLQTGVEDTRSALSTAPVLQIAGINGTVRLTRVRDPEGNIFDYKSPLDIYTKRSEEV